MNGKKPEGQEQPKLKPEQKEKLMPKPDEQKELAPPASESEKLLAPPAEEKLLPSAEAGEGKKLAEYENALKRLQAEFENYKKRIAKDNEQRSRFEGEGLMLKLLPFLDDMDAALEAADKSKDEQLKESVSLLRGKLLSTLAKDGLSEMKCMGEQFDPYKHEAVLHEPSDKKENTVVRVIRKGYLLRDKIIRHAIVSVSNGKKL